MLAALGSAVFYASTVVIFKKESSNYTWKETIFFQNLVAAILFMPFLFINEPFPSSTQMIQVSIFTFSIGVVAFGLFFSALQRIKASTASFLAYTELFFAMIFSIIFLGEPISWNLILGGIFIILATLGIRR